MAKVKSESISKFVKARKSDAKVAISKANTQVASKLTAAEAKKLPKALRDDFSKKAAAAGEKGASTAQLLKEYGESVAAIAQSVDVNRDKVIDSTEAAALPKALKTGFNADTRMQVNYKPVKGLPALSDLSGVSNVGVSDIEALHAEKTAAGMRVAVRFRGISANYAPHSLEVVLTQTALGDQSLKTVTSVVKPVAPHSTVSEGEFFIDYSEFAALGLQPGAKLGINARWTSGHDRYYNENPTYTFTAP